VLSKFICTCFPKKSWKVWLSYIAQVWSHHELSNFWLLLVSYSSQNEAEDVSMWSSSHPAFTLQLLFTDSTSRQWRELGAFRE